MIIRVARSEEKKIAQKKKKTKNRINFSSKTQIEVETNHDCGAKV